MKLTPEQEKWLDWLIEHGGSGYVDRYGRIVAGGSVSVQGASVSWMKLLAAGLISGRDGRIFATSLHEDA